MNSGIYRIKNTINGKQYFGSAVDLTRRFREHRGRLRKGSHKNPHLQAAWLKYGQKAFVFEHVCYVEPKYLLDIEQQYLDGYESYNRLNGYNIAPKAGNTLGVYPSPETRKKQSLAAMNRPKRKLSQEHKDKLRKAHSGEMAAHRKLSWGKVNQIRKDYSILNVKQSELAQKYNVAQTTISEILRNVIWVDKKYIRVRRSDKCDVLTKEQASEIRNKYVPRKYSYQKLADEYGVSRKIISDIIANKKWRDDEQGSRS